MVVNMSGAMKVVTAGPNVEMAAVPYDRRPCVVVVTRIVVAVVRIDITVSTVTMAAVAAAEARTMAITSKVNSNPSATDDIGRFGFARRSLDGQIFDFYACHDLAPFEPRK
jgi:hypothetical protein